MPKSKLLWLLAAFSVLIMGTAGWYIGTLGTPPDPLPDPPKSQPAPTPLIADLKRDWSNAANPNPQPVGIWSFNADNTPLAKIDSWVSAPGIPGWGQPANVIGDFLPFFCQNAADGGPTNPLGTDLKPGDIVCHATDPTNSSTNASATIAWQCLLPGTASVDGRLWPTRNFDRTNAWKLLLTSAGTTQTLATGTLPEDGSLSRDNPSPINIKPFPILKDDRLQLVLFRSGNIGDFTAINLAITLTPSTPLTTQPTDTHPAPLATAPPTYGLPVLLISLTALAMSTLTLLCVIILLFRQRPPK